MANPMPVPRVLVVSVQPLERGKNSVEEFLIKTYTVILNEDTAGGPVFFTVDPNQGSFGTLVLFHGIAYEVVEKPGQLARLGFDNRHTLHLYNSRHVFLVDCCA